MPRTVYCIPTSLTGDELAARVGMFLHCHKFKRLIYRAEELYKIGGWLHRPGYLKLISGNGFLHIEAFYLLKYGREKEIGDGFFFDPYGLRGKLQELSKVIGDGQPMNYVPPTAEQAAGQQQPYNPAGNQLYASVSPQNDAPAGQQDAKGKSPFNKGCLTACLVVAIVFLCMLGGCIAIGLLYQGEDSPIAKNQEVSTLGWKTLQENRYSFRYPEDWKVYTNKENPALNKNIPKASTDKGPFLGKKYLRNLMHDSIFPPAEEQAAKEEAVEKQSGEAESGVEQGEVIPKTTVPPRLRYNQYVLVKESSDGNVYAIVDSRKNSGLYDELIEENFIDTLFPEDYHFLDTLFPEDYRGFACGTFEKGAVKGRRALFALYSGELAAKKVKIYYYLIEDDDTILTIWFRANDEDYDKFQPVFDTVISTLKLK